MAQRLFTYAKFADDSKFRAYDINKGVPVTRLVRATIMDDTEENREKLQELADLNKDKGLVIQLRTISTRIKFQTE